jgi:ribosomal protein L14
MLKSGLKVLKAETCLTAVDNSGAASVKCLRPYGNKKVIDIGDFCTVTVKSVRLVRKAVRKKIYLFLLLQHRRFVVRSTGVAVKFFTNQGCLLAEKSRFLGTRVFGSTFREVSKAGVEGFRSKFRSVV